MKNKLKNKWNLLYVLLAAIIVFSLFAVPNIAKSMLDGTKNQIVTVVEQGQ